MISMLDNIISIFESKSESDIRFMCEVYIPKLTNDEIKILSKHLRKLGWMSGANNRIMKDSGPYMFNEDIVIIKNDNIYEFPIPKLLFDELNHRWNE